MKTKKIKTTPIVVTNQIVNWKLILIYLGVVIAGVMIMIKLFSLWRVRLVLNNVQLSQKLYIDPLELMKKISEKNKNYILIDIRSQEEYDLGHIKTAVSLPAYERVDEIEKTRTKENNYINEFKKLKDKNKELFIYGYLPNAQIIKETAILFMRNGYQVKILSVGWEQWRSGYTQWNPAAQLRGMDIGLYIEPVTYAPPTLIVPGQL